MADAVLLGDLRERPDGGFDGWCWAPDRPEERLIVELLVNDTLASSMVAAIFRRDLMLSGHGDGRHGFLLRVPPNLPEARSECLITARERRGGAVFGRVLRRAKGASPVGGTQLENTARSVGALWQELAAATPARQEPPSARLRTAFGALAARLAAGPHASPPFLPLGPALTLPRVARPVLSVVLPVRRASVALRQIADFAAGMALAGAELIAVDTGEDPSAALLPARVRNLRYLRDARSGGTAAAANVAVDCAGGASLVVLGVCPERPSAAALLALAAALAAHPTALLLGPTAADAAERVGGPRAPLAARLPGRLGLSFAVARGRWDELGPLLPSLQDGAALECADLACRAALLGMPVLAVAEPSPTPAAVVAAAPEARAALAAFRDRWGPPITMLDQRRRPA